MMLARTTHAAPQTALPYLWDIEDRGKIFGGFRRGVLGLEKSAKVLGALPPYTYRELSRVYS